MLIDVRIPKISQSLKRDSKTLRTPILKNIWDKVFKNGLSKICGRQLLKNLKWYGLPKQTISLQIF